VKGIEVLVMDELLKLLIVAVVAGASGYLGSYLNKKGENLATREDIDDLVKQVKAVTTATKEIEAKISNDVWDRQKHWELKREVLFEITKRIAAVKVALFNMDVMYGVLGSDDPKTNAANEKVWEAASSLDEATLLAKLVCGQEVNRLLLIFGDLVRGSAEEISTRETDSKKTAMILRSQADAVAKAIRNEIGIEATD